MYQLHLFVRYFSSSQDLPRACSSLSTEVKIFRNQFCLRYDASSYSWHSIFFSKIIYKVLEVINPLIETFRSEFSFCKAITILLRLWREASDTCSFSLLLKSSCKRLNFASFSLNSLCSSSMLVEIYEIIGKGCSTFLAGNRRN